MLLSLWNYARDQYQKIFENKPHIFKRNVTFTMRDLWGKNINFEGKKNPQKFLKVVDTSIAMMVLSVKGHVHTHQEAFFKHVSCFSFFFRISYTPIKLQN